MIVGTIIAPPVPARVWIPDIRDRPKALPVPSKTGDVLRVHDNEVVAVRPAIIAGLLVKLITDGAVVLKTTMERHMHATSTRTTSLGHVHKPGVTHAVGMRIAV